MYKGKQITQIMPISHKESVTQLIVNLSQELFKLAEHLFVASWQKNQFAWLQKNIPESWVVLNMDFAENYSCVAQQEVQSAHWSHNQVTIHPTVAYYKCQEEGCTKIMMEHLIFVSDDLNHDAAAVQKFVELAIEHLIHKRRLSITKLIQMTDGCAAQYKSRVPFVDISYSIKDFGFPVERHFYGSRHGKGPSDGAGAVVKSVVRRTVMGGNAVVNNSADFFEIANLKLSKEDDNHTEHFKRTLFNVTEINHDRPERTNQCKTLKGTRKVQAVQAVSEMLINTKNLTCFCNGCIDGSLDCQNKAYVDEWVLHQCDTNRARGGVQRGGRGQRIRGGVQRAGRGQRLIGGVQRGGRGQRIRGGVQRGGRSPRVRGGIQRGGRGPRIRGGVQRGRRGPRVRGRVQRGGRGPRVRGGVQRGGGPSWTRKLSGQKNDDLSSDSDEDSLLPDLESDGGTDQSMHTETDDGNSDSDQSIPDHTTAPGLEAAGMITSETQQDGMSSTISSCVERVETSNPNSPNQNSSMDLELLTMIMETQQDATSPTIPSHSEEQYVHPSTQTFLSQITSPEFESYTMLMETQQDGTAPSIPSHSEELHADPSTQTILSQITSPEIEFYTMLMETQQDATIPTIPSPSEEQHADPSAQTILNQITSPEIESYTMLMETQQDGTTPIIPSHSEEQHVLPSAQTILSQISSPEFASNAMLMERQQDATIPTIPSHSEEQHADPSAQIILNRITLPEIESYTMLMETQQDVTTPTISSHSEEQHAHPSAQTILNRITSPEFEPYTMLMETQQKIPAKSTTSHSHAAETKQESRTRLSIISVGRLTINKLLAINSLFGGLLNMYCLDQCIDLLSACNELKEPFDAHLIGCQSGRLAVGDVLHKNKKKLVVTQHSTTHCPGIRHTVQVAAS